MTEPLTLANVERAAADLFGVTTVDLAGRSKRWPLHHYRTATMIVMRETVGASWPAIGAWFGRDHTTVMSNVAQASDEAKRCAADLTARVDRGPRTVDGTCPVCDGSMVEADPTFEVAVGYVYRTEGVRCGRCSMTFTTGRREFHGHLSDMQANVRATVS